MSSAPTPIRTSSNSGAPVEASEPAPDAAAATDGALTGPESATRAARAGVAPDAEAEEGVPVGTVAVEGDVVGCGHEASAWPSNAACTPQIVTGTVPPVPGLPGLPVDVEVELVPVHVPAAVPSRAAVTAQAVTGANTGTDPGVVAVETCEGSHELLAVPSTATTTLHAFTGMTPSTGALWLASVVGRPLVSGNPAAGMHMPLDEPSTSTTAPQAVTGTKMSAA